jgi:peptide/nickel transport system substrate-binding protein
VKIDLRWQLLLAIVCLAFVAFLLSSQIQSAGNCTLVEPSAGGRLTEGMVGLPQYINPLLADSNPIDRQLTDLIFDGLTRYENGNIVPALAESWSYSEDNKTVTFNLDARVQWHDGQPVGAADVAFTYGLLQNEAFPAGEKLREFWQTVTISVENESQISFTLPQPYSPFIDATTRGILPAHILADIPVSDLADHEFNQGPIGTGPFYVIPGNRWKDDGYLRLAPYPNHWRGGTKLDALEFRFYPNGRALEAAFEEGQIQAITWISPGDVGDLGALQGMQMYTSPSAHFAELIFNMTDSAAPALRSLNVRKALAEALDRDAIADEALSGQAIPLTGPYLPSSWAYNPGLITEYSFQLDQAASRLNDEGWTVPDGADDRQKDGESLSLRLLAGNSSMQLDIAREIARQWGILGISVELIPVNPAELRTELMAREYDVALLDVAPLGDPDLYDFWSQEAIVRGQNFGGWNNRRASEALEAARNLPLPEERKRYYDAFLGYLDEDLPVLTLFQYVDTYGISETVHEVSIGLINIPRDRFKTFNEWFLLFKEVSVVCAESEA